MDFLVFWLFSLLAIFSGVGSVDDGDDGWSPEPSVSAEPSPAASPTEDTGTDPIEEQFFFRTHLPDCGHFQLERGPYEEAARPGWLCLQDAAYVKGGEAEFVAASPGAAPVTTWVRVSDGVMEVYVNDPSAGSLDTWTYDTCSVEDSSFRQGCPEPVAVLSGT
jgi:hypothetical protein